MLNNKLLDIVHDLRETPWMKSLISQKDVRAYLVGGIVRDAFLGKSSKDIDIVIEGMQLDEIKTSLEDFGKVIENQVGDSFKVLKFKPTGFVGEPYDISTPRKDVKVGKGHTGFKAVSVDSIHEDLARRDFTINSMAVNIETEELIDPFDGASALEYRVIKATNEEAFTEDPLRLMRAIQFASRFDFNIIRSTKKLMQEHAESLQEISGERILGELQKIIFKKGNMKLAIDLMKETHLDAFFFGFLDPAFWNTSTRHLDDLSFMYIICSGESDFYSYRLKGDSYTAMEMEVLGSLMATSGSQDHYDEDLRHKAFLSIKKAISIDRAVILPYSIRRIFDEMREGNIPTTMDQIAINGRDVEQKIEQKGPIIGKILTRLQKDALMNRVDWKSHKAMMSHLDLVIEEELWKK